VAGAGATRRVVGGGQSARARGAFVWRYARPVWYFLAMLVVLYMAGPLLGLVIPLVQSSLVNDIVGGLRHSVAPYFVQWALLATAAQGASVGSQLLGTYVHQKVAYSAREDTLRHALHLPPQVFMARGDSQILADVDYAADAGLVLTEGLAWVAGLLARIGGGIVALTHLSPSIALAVVPFAAGYTVIPRITAQWIRRTERAEQDARVRARATLLEHLKAFVDLRLFGAREWAVKHLEAPWSGLMRAAWHRQVSHQGSDTGNWLLQTLGYIVTWVVAVHEVHTGRLTFGGLVAATLYLNMLFAPLNAVLSFQYSWFGYLLDIDRAMGFFATAQDQAFSPHAERPDMEGAFELAQVAVQYAGRPEPVLIVPSLTIDHGEVVSVVGPNGSGKSTLLRLLLGMAPPTSGRVTLSGADVVAIDDGVFRRAVGGLLSEAAIVSGTLRENLLLAKGEASDTEIVTALDDVGLAEWHRLLEGGLDARLGADGVMPSNGQRQRLGIARLLLQDPDVVILDEPTSALDPESVGQMWGLLRGRPGRTVVIATHDPWLAAAAGRVVRVEQGRVH